MITNDTKEGLAGAVGGGWHSALFRVSYISGESVGVVTNLGV